MEDALKNYNGSWTLDSILNKKEPLIVVISGTMTQQPIQATFLGVAVEEKFHLDTISLSILPCIPLVSNHLKNMVHPDISPTQLTEGAKEGYFLVDLSNNQDFNVEPEFFPTSYQDDYTEHDNCKLQVFLKNICICSNNL